MTLQLAAFQSTLTRPDDPSDPNGIAHATDSTDVGVVTALFVSLGAEFEIRVDDTSGISPGMIMTGADYSGTVTVVTVISSTSLEMSIIAPDTVPAPGTVLTFTNPTYIAGAATKAARAVAKLAWANYVQDYREAYRVGDSSGPPEFPDGGEIDYADD
jgi:hypothetical protein